MPFKEIPAIRKDTFKARTIRSAFKKRGSYPLNSEKVIGPKTPTPELRIFSTPPPPSSSISPPFTIRGLRRSIGKAQDYIDNNPKLDQSCIRRLDRVFRSAAQTQELAGQLRDDFQVFMQHRTPQSGRKSLKRLRESGPLDVEDDNRHIIQYRSEEERRQELRRLKKQRSKNRNISTTQADMEILPVQEGSKMESDGHN